MKRIMFSDRFGLMGAVLDKRKTMTRRIIKSNYEDVKAYHANGGWHFIADTDDGDSVELKPQYEIGEEVWIAQSYKSLGYGPHDWIENIDGGLQPATELAGYNNKMFVRNIYLEHRIRITGVSVERLQDITDEDSLKEGAEKWIDCYVVSDIMENQGKNNVCFDTPCEAFAALIDRISGKGTWQRNPWVFAYTFELVR